MEKIFDVSCGKINLTNSLFPSGTTLQDAKIFFNPVFHDERGSFELNWDQSESATQKHFFSPSSSATSQNIAAFTLRGLHYQETPFCQAKVISCTKGKILDVMVDLRNESATYLKWAAIELTAGQGWSIYIPKGFAHGFLTLVENTTVSYLIEGAYSPRASRVIRWNDPIIGVEWPTEDPILSDRDKFAEDRSSE